MEIKFLWHICTSIDAEDILKKKIGRMFFENSVFNFPQPTYIWNENEVIYD